MDERKLILTVNYPPSVNRYLMQRGSRRFLSPEARAFTQHVIDVMPHDWEPLTGPVQVLIELYPGTRHKSDIDNRVKRTLDSLQEAGAYLDDFQVGKLTVIRRQVIPKAGKAVITLEPLDA